MNEIYKGMDNAAEKINKNFEEFNDYVIEQSGDAFEGYRKWKSGILEFWMRGEITVPGNGYVEEDIAIPTTGSEIISGGNAWAMLRTSTGNWLNITVKRALVKGKPDVVNVGVENKGGEATVMVQIQGFGDWQATE